MAKLMGHVKNNEAPPTSTYQGHLFGSGVFCTGLGKVGVHFSRFLTILSHFGFIIFYLTHRSNLLAKSDEINPPCGSDYTTKLYALILIENRGKNRGNSKS